MEFLKTVDVWFLSLVVVLLGLFFVWAVQYIFGGLKQSIEDLGKSFASSVNELKELVKELYDHRNDHEKRIVAIETKCAWEHEYDHPRTSAGRRFYDPPTIPKPDELIVENFNNKGR